MLARVSVTYGALVAVIAMILFVTSPLTTSANEKLKSSMPKEIYESPAGSHPEPARTVLDFDNTSGDLETDSARAVIWLKFKLSPEGGIDTTEVIYSTHPDHGLEYRAVQALKSAHFAPSRITDYKPTRWFYHEVVFDRELFNRVRQSYGDSTPVVDTLEHLPQPDEFIAVEVFPEMIKHGKPEYPASAKSKGIIGVVWVKCLVDKTGIVRKATIGKTSGNADLDSAAIKASYKSRFKPALQNGQPIACWVTYRVNFQLD